MSPRRYSPIKYTPKISAESSSFSSHESPSKHARRGASNSAHGSYHSFRSKSSSSTQHCEIEIVHPKRSYDSMSVVIEGHSARPTVRKGRASRAQSADTVIVEERRSLRLSLKLDGSHLGEYDFIDDMSL